MIASVAALVKQNAPFQLFQKAMANMLSMQTNVSIVAHVQVLALLVLLFRNNQKVKTPGNSWGFSAFLYGELL